MSFHTSRQRAGQHLVRNQKGIVLNRRRVNLTLPNDAYIELSTYAQQLKVPTAQAVRIAIGQWRIMRRREA